MATTIQISKALQTQLTKRKVSDRETYEEIIWDLIEDTLELSAETKKDLEEARKDIRTGKSYTLQEAKKKLGM